MGVRSAHRDPILSPRGQGLCRSLSSPSKPRAGPGSWGTGSLGAWCTLSMSPEGRLVSPHLSVQRAWTCGLGSLREHVTHAHNPFLLQRRKSRYAELDFEVSAGASLRTDGLGTRAISASGNGGGAQARGHQQVGQRGGCGCPSWLRTRGPNPQKIMHTRKRHQDMFQDLNRKLQHAAEKEKEVPGIESKVRSMGSAPAATGFCLLSSHPHPLDSLVGLSHASPPFSDVQRAGQWDPEPGSVWRVPDCPPQC